MSEPDKTLGRYQGASGVRYHASKRLLPDEAFGWVAALRARKLQPHINATAVVFEYGVGYGWNLAALKCGRKLGFDVGEFLAPTVRGHGIDFVASAESLPNESTDVVVCHHTLEHVRNPSAVLLEIQRLLRPAGQLLLFTPYERERRFQRFREDEPNHHLYSWNVQTLCNLVVDCGFRVTESRLRRFRFDRFAAIAACRLRLGGRGYRVLRAGLLMIMPEYEVQVIASKE